MRNHYFSFTKTFFVLIAGFCMQQGLAQDAMFIAPNGNVGIGTSSPTNKLSVEGNANFTGNVGIGTATPTNKLSVEGNANFTGNTNFTGNASFTGNVGIGTTSPTNKLSVNGNANFTGNVGIGTSAPRGIFDVSTEGDIYLVKDPSKALNQSLFLPGHIYIAPHWNSDISYLQARRKDESGSTNLIFRTTNNGQLNDIMMLAASGNVGIGTTSPTEAKLVVKGWVGRTIPPITGYAYKDSWQGGGGSGLSNISIYTENPILAPSYYAYSDSRIKTDFHPSDIAADLATLKQIQVTDYRYKDPFQYGNAVKKGIIAQEVEAVFPQAVNKHTDYITDIFAMPKEVSLSEKTLTVSMEKAHGLANGDMLRLITPTEVVETAVEVLDNNTFMVKDWTKDSKEVFVYGKKVDDFRAVDFDRLTILSISSIQQLCKEMEAMKAENAAYKKALLSLEARMDRVEENVKPASAAIR